MVLFEEFFEFVREFLFIELGKVCGELLGYCVLECVLVID